MGRSIVAILLGLVAGVVLIGVVEVVGHIVFPLPADVKLDDPVAIKAAFAAGKVPTASLAAVLAAHALGSAGGGWVAARMSRRSPIVHATVIGAVLGLAGIANLLMIPHPAWFMVVDVLLYMPCAWFGGRLALPPPSVTTEAQPAS